MTPERIEQAAKQSSPHDHHMQSADIEYQEGFKQGAQWALDNQWISVEDELPDDSFGRVLVWVIEQNDLGKSEYVWNCSYSPLHGFSDLGQAYHVTHWMPLPQSPIK